MCICMCRCLCGYVHMSASALELQLERVGSYLIWVLATEFQSSGRAASPLNH